MHGTEKVLIARPITQNGDINLSQLFLICLFIIFLIFHLFYTLAISHYDDQKLCQKNGMNDMNDLNNLNDEQSE